MRLWKFQLPSGFICLMLSLNVLGNNDETSDPTNRMKVLAKGLFSHDFMTFSINEVGNTGKTAAFGGGASFEYPLLDFLQLGAEFNTQIEVSREFHYFDINAFAKFPFAIALNNSIPHFFVRVPVGFSLARFSSAKISLKSLPKGLNAGVSLGKEFFFAQRFGILLEGGYLYRYLGGELTNNNKFAVHFHEFSLSVGFSYLI
jgi:hypothetical protein